MSEFKTKKTKKSRKKGSFKVKEAKVLDLTQDEEHKGGTDDNPSSSSIKQSSGTASEIKHHLASVVSESSFIKGIKQIKNI